MTSPLDDRARRRGTFITLDGPGGVGKTTAIAAVTAALATDGVIVHPAAQPSRAQLGEIARHGTDTYHGMALACLCAADRHHQLATEILPALDAGHLVLCDRYVASSLVLQGLDGIAHSTVWELNNGIYQPDLTIILPGDPADINTRLRARGGHSRFERALDNSIRETAGYAAATAFLAERGWPTVSVACAADDPAATTARIVSLVHRVLKESPAWV